MTQAEPQPSIPPSSPSLLSSESDAESDSEDSQSETDEASKFGEVTSPQSQHSSGVQPSGPPPSVVSTPQAVSISSSPASHASNHLTRSTFMTRILADPAEPWKDASDYQTRLDPQGLICTNHYEDASGKPLFTYNSQFSFERMA